MSDTDFTVLHNWMRDNEAMGTVFVKGDVESVYEEARGESEDAVLPTFEEAWEEIKHSYEWRKGGDNLTEQGNEMIFDMVWDFIRAKKKEQE